MRFEQLRKKILKYPVFRGSDVFKWFPEEKSSNLQVQLSRWLKQEKIERLRQGIYLLREHKIEDPFCLAPILSQPSYISLETALNSFGIIPDIPVAITSVTVNRTGQFKIDQGFYLYHQIKKELFFGYTKVSRKPFFYFIAQPEKAVLDYLYFRARGIYPKTVLELRFEIGKSFSWRRFRQYAGYFGKTTQELVKAFIGKYIK